MAKILIIRLTSLGDVIFTLPLVNCLKDAGHQVDFLVSERGAGVIENNPCISKIHYVPLAKWRKNKFSVSNITEFWKLVGALRNEKYDIAFDCQQMFKSLFLFLFCGAKRRITFADAREFSAFGGNEFVKPKAKFRDFNYHIVERNLDLARYINIVPKDIKFTLPETDENTKMNVDKILSVTDKAKKTVVIAPATTWKNKHWDINNWKEVVNYINGKVNIIFTGTKADEGLITSISNGIDCLNLAGKTSMPKLIEVFRRADLVISVDSGSSNLAWACGHPALITIFTCTPAKRFGPYGDEKKYYTIQGGLSCQPCFKKRCSFKHCNCIKYPEPESIIEIIKSVI